MMIYEVPGGGFVRSWIISADEGLIVVDPGSIGTADSAREFIRGRTGWKMSQVRAIAVTHFHVDHIGGIARLLRACPDDTVVYFHARVRDYLTGKKEIPALHNWKTQFWPIAIKGIKNVHSFNHLLIESMAGIPLRGFGNRFLPPIPMEKIRWLCVGGEGRCDLAFGGWEAMETPGHTADSISFYNAKERALICGDLILNLDDDGGHLNAFCEDRKRIEETFRFLSSAIAPRAIYPAHGATIRHPENALLAVKTA